MTRSEHILATSRAIHREGLYFREYAILTAISAGITSREDLSEETGINGKEMRYIILRSPHLDRDAQRIFLTLRGEQLMTRIHERMNKPKKEKKV